MNSKLRVSLIIGVVLIALGAAAAFSAGGRSFLGMSSPEGSSINNNSAKPIFYRMLLSGNRNNFNLDSDEHYLSELIIAPYSFTPKGSLLLKGQELPLLSYTALFSLTGDVTYLNRNTLILPDFSPNPKSKDPRNHFKLVVNGRFPLRGNEEVELNKENIKYIPVELEGNQLEYLYIGEVIIATNITNEMLKTYKLVPCDGRKLSVSEDDVLFSLIGNTFGGDGKTDFAVPNFNSFASAVKDAKYYMATSGIYPAKN